MPIMSEGSIEPRQVPILWAAFSILCGIGYLILTLTWLIKRPKDFYGKRISFFRYVIWDSCDDYIGGMSATIALITTTIIFGLSYFLDTFFPLS